MKKCRKWEPIACSATISIFFAHIVFLTKERDRQSCPGSVAATSVYETSLHAPLPFSARGRFIRTGGGAGGQECARSGNAADRGRQGVAGSPWRDRPSLGGASPPTPAHTRATPRLTSTSYFGSAFCVNKRSQVICRLRAVVAFCSEAVA